MQRTHAIEHIFGQLHILTDEALELIYKQVNLLPKRNLNIEDNFEILEQAGKRFSDDAWDVQMKADVVKGRFASLAQEALKEHEQDQSLDAPF